MLKFSQRQLDNIYFLSCLLLVLNNVQEQKGKLIGFYTTKEIISHAGHLGHNLVLGWPLDVLAVGRMVGLQRTEEHKSAPWQYPQNPSLILTSTPAFATHTASSRRCSWSQRLCRSLRHGEAGGAAAIFSPVYARSRDALSRSRTHASGLRVAH
jgi:hypothetical protein